LTGQVALVAGGELSGDSIASVEVYSPDGGCQYSMSSLPLPLLGLQLGISLNHIIACSGYDTSTQMNNLICWRFYPKDQNWSKSVRSLKYSAKRSNMIYKHNLLCRVCVFISFSSDFVCKQ
jgi:hypothetical protein